MIKQWIIACGFILGLSNNVMAQSTNVYALSNTHVMQKLTTKGKYIMLPIEEKSAVSSFKLLVNNQVVKTMNIRPAIDKVDYYVPVDMAEFANEPVLIEAEIKAEIKDEPRRHSDVRNYLFWDKVYTTNNINVTNTETLRPLYHHTPQWGWMNDPNGLFYKDGEWHLYYQYNPYGSQWENMHWAHAVSKDLIRWEHKGIALAPDALGTIFSGCAVVDKNNTAGFGKDAIVAFYTSAGVSQTQSLAYSIDNGNTFHKYNLNPVITSDIPDFRDPHVFWHKETNKWIMLLAAGQEMRIYSSANLKEWTQESTFGLTYGNHDGVWECPDLIRLKDPSTNQDKWVLLCNINPGGPNGGSATQYFVGSFDGKTFVCDSEPKTTKWQDYGKDHYATVSFDNAPEGRAVCIGWMSNWQYANQVPTIQYRSANTIARDLYLFKDGAELYLASAPSKEYLSLRGKAVVNKKGNVKVDKMFDKPNGAYELLVDFNPSVNAKLSITLANTKGENVVLIYDVSKKTFSIDRKNSGDVAFSELFAVDITAPVHGKPLTQLRIFVDKSSIEVFGNNGQLAFTNIVFPSLPYNSLDVNGQKCKVNNVKVFNLKI